MPRSWLRVLGVAAALLALALIPLWIHQSGARASDTNHDSEITAPNQERLLTLLEDFREAWNASDLDAAGAFFPLRHTSRGEQLGNRIEALGWRRADLPRVGKSSILRGDLAIEARTRFDLLPSTGPGGLGTTNHRLRERQIQLLWVWEKEPDSARADWHLLEVELPAPK